MNSTPKVIVQTFDNYAKSQLTFVQSVQELASKSSFVECLINNRVVELVLPLAINRNPAVRINAVLGLARLAGNSQLCVEQILFSKKLLNQIFGQITNENKYYKKNCMHLIKNLCKYSSVSSEIVMKECEGIDAILTCMKDFDVFVREGAMQVITAIARQNMDLLQLSVSSGVLVEIVRCLKEEQQNLKLYALSTLDEIVKDNEDLAKTVVGVLALPLVINFLSPNCTDIKVQRSALVLIKDIVKHSLYLTECAIESNLFPEVLLLMSHTDECIRINAASVIQEVVKHSVQIAEMVVNNGGLSLLLNVILCRKEYSPVSAVLTLGYIGAMSPSLASAVIQSKALTYFTEILKSNDVDQYSKAGVVWALGFIGHHSPEHASSICAGDAITTMMDIYTKSEAGSESREKCIYALQQILNECDDYLVLDKLLLKSSIPDEIMTCILNKIGEILPKNSKARRSFMVNGHLKMIQNLKPDKDSSLHQVIKSINCCFPEDVLQMLAGDFPEVVMKTVDKYEPKIQCLFYNPHLKSEELLNKSFKSGKTHSSGDKL